MERRLAAVLCLLVATAARGEALRLYTYPVEPSENPNYLRYPVQHPGLSVFDRVPEFATLRDLRSNGSTLVDYEQLLQQFCLNASTTLGHLVWPGDATLLFATNYKDFIDYVASKGLYITSIHGFSPVGPGFRPPLGVLDYLSLKLGPRWLGMAAGEQDGHYFDALVWEEVPLNADRPSQYCHFRDYFRGLEGILGPRMTTLMSSVFPHYELKSGHYTMAGAETSQHGPNAQLRYSFIRGAGKQYGVIWYGNVSIYNRWGHKTYLKPAAGSTSAQPTGKHRPAAAVRRNYTCSSNSSEVRDASGPLCGTSLNLMKRLMYAQMLYSSGYVSIEREWFYSEQPQQLSPIGLLQHNAYLWSQQFSSLGVHVAPLALYLDFFTGWAAPRLKRNYEFHVWNNLPYSSGDHLTDGLLRLVYPSYQDASYFHDETGVSSPTPYGDGLDVLLSDAASWVLQQYDTMLVSSELVGGLEVEANLRSFLQAGGNVVITAANLARLPGNSLGVNITSSSCRQVAAGAKVILQGGETLTEPYNMSVCGLAFPGNASVLASLVDGTALAVELPLASGGSLTVFASPYAVSATEQGQPRSQVDQTLASPRPLLEHARHLLHAILSRATLFSSTANLTLTVSHTGGRDFHVLVSNPELREQPLKLVCGQAAISKLQEVALDQAEKGQVGYLPDGYQGSPLGNSTATSIAGVDTRLFSVSLADSASLHFLPRTQPKPAPSGVGLHLRNIRHSIRHEVLLMPSFFQHFSSVVVDSDYLTSQDEAFLKIEGAWLESQGLAVLVDATPSINLFPGLRMVRDSMGLHNTTIATFTSMLHKMAALGSHNLTLSLHAFSGGRNQSEADFNTTLHYITNLAASLHISVYMLDARKNPFDLLPMSRFLDSCGLPNMPLVLNLARLVNYGQDMKYDSILQARSPLLYVSAPAWDQLGIGYAVNLPISQTNSTGRAQVKDTLRHVCSLRTCPYQDSPSLVPAYPLVLDAVYQDSDQLFADIQFLESFLLELSH